MAPDSPTPDSERLPFEAPSTPAGYEADVESPPEGIVRHGGTFEAFRFRAYSLFWSGAIVSNVGTWMQNFALAILVYSFRSSSADLGIVNFVAGGPTLLLGLYAGVLADRLDRRKLIIWAQVGLMLQAGALALLFDMGRLSSHHAIEALLWVVSLGLVAGIFTALSFPAWQAMIPDLVPRDTLLNGIALNSAQFQSARLLGPLIAGAMILVNLTVGDIFWVNAASFLFVIAALWVIRPQFAQPRGLGRSSDPGESPWRTLTAGVRYAREHSVIGVLILSTAVLTVFGMAYMMIAPAVVDHSLLAAAHGAALLTNSAAWKARQALIDRQTAYLMAANGFGAVLSALVVASLPATVRRERIIPWTLLLLAAALTGFGLSHNLYLTLVMSSIAGAALLTTNSLVNTSIQTRVPGQLRGRVMSLFVMSFMGLMPFAALIFGFLAQAIGPGPAIIGGAVVLFAWGITLISRPRMLCPTG